MAFLSERGDVERRVAAAHAGASLYLPKPVDPYGFGAAVEQMLALGRDEKMRVLVIDDDADFAACVAAVLEPHGIVVRTAHDATRLVETLDEARPDLVLLDAMLPQVNGWDAIRIMRTMPEWRDVPILFLTGRTDLESRIAAFDAGADDYLAKPLVPEELLSRVRVRLDRRRLIRETTERDPLTRCMSRGALLDALASRLSEARRHGRTLSVALIDVDRFKRVNDAYGHLVGDHVLMALGRLLTARFRLEDLRGRWGGEEFVIVFPNEPAPDRGRGAVARARRVSRDALPERARRAVLRDLQRRHLELPGRRRHGRRAHPRRRPSPLSREARGPRARGRRRSRSELTFALCRSEETGTTGRRTSETSRLHYES